MISVSVLIILFLIKNNLTERIKLHGCGASLPAEVYEAWVPAFESYRREFVNIDFEYFATGSGEAIQSIHEKETSSNLCLLRKVDFFGSDIPLSTFDYDKSPNLQMLPILGGSVVLAFNLGRISNLTLKKEHVVKIYNGTIKKWNDADLKQINPHIKLPDEKILVVARSDNSGTTQIFTEALSAISKEWRNNYGIFSDSTNETWPPGVISFRLKRNRGVSGILLSYRNSIGYISTADANTALLPYARIKQGDDILDVEPDKMQETMKRAMGHFSDRMTVTLANHVRNNEYPFIGYTYLVFNKTSNGNCDRIRELVRYFYWVMKEKFPQNDAKDFKMAGIPKTVSDLLFKKVIDKIKCGGNNMLKVAKDQMDTEELSKQKWRIPVIIAIPIISLLILSLISYLIVQQIRLRRSLLTDDWKIPKDEIILRWSRKDGLLRPDGSKYQNSMQSVASLTISAITNFSYTTTTGGAGIGKSVEAIGLWKEKAVVLRSFPNALSLERIACKKCLIFLRDKINHFNVVSFLGVTIFDNAAYLVSDHSPKGTLRDVVQDDRYKLDENIKFSLALDVAGGLKYLHSQNLNHGNLTSDSCVVDQRWNVRIADWEYTKLAEFSIGSRRASLNSNLSESEKDYDVEARNFMWYAPEVLKGECPTKASDVYSFSIILVEIFTREDPYYSLAENLSPVKIIEEIKAKDIRPNLDDPCLNPVKNTLEKCWAILPGMRASAATAFKELKSQRPSKKSVMDCMMDAIEGYVTKLEEKVKDRTRELEMANLATEALLHQILPPSVAKKLSLGETVDPEKFESVSIFFSDIVGFTSLSAESSPLEIVKLLNELYSVFDTIIDKKDVYKVETIGDAYMVVSGLPSRNGNKHADRITEMALDFMASVKQFRIRHKPSKKLLLRAGIHSGPVVAGVVGQKMPRYCLFGDTVNTASRMESTSEPLKIQVSPDTHKILNKQDEYLFKTRENVEIKGKGKMTTYFVENKINYEPFIPKSHFDIND